MKHDILFFKTYLSCFNEELLDRYKPLAQFMKDYPSVDREIVLKELELFLVSSDSYVKAVKDRCMKLNSDERVLLMDKLNVAIKSAVRHFEMPGEKAFVINNMQRI